MMGAICVGPYKIVPSSPQEPPCGLGASASTLAAPPSRSIRFNVLAAKNASDRPSGDQNGSEAPSVPGKNRDRSDRNSRTQSRESSEASPTAATHKPSRDTAMDKRSRVAGALTSS